MTNLNFRNQKIDFLRGLAIIAVLILHFNISYHISESTLNKIFSVSFLNSIASNGNYGVTMFFVISGFLITRTSLERYSELGNIDIVGFYILRFARIMPCLVLVITLITIFSLAQIPIFQNHPNSTTLFIAVLSVLTFWHNLLMEKVGYFNYCLNIFWSLSVEEIFYIAFPVLCLFFKKTKLIIPFLVSLIIIGPIYRSFYTDNEIVALYGYFSCFDAIAIGCCAALLAGKVQLKGLLVNSIRYGAWILIVIVYLYSGIMENVVAGISLIAFGTTILLILASQKSSHQPLQMNLFSRAICWFGKNTYELYLFHIIVLAVMKETITPERLGDFSKLLWMATFIIVSAIVAGTIAKYYSQPLNKKLRLLFFGLRKRNIKSAAKCKPVSIYNSTIQLKKKIGPDYL